MRVCVLISGRGTNMEALVRGADRYDVAAVVSSRPEAPGVLLAESLGVPCSVEREPARMGRVLEDIKPDLVCMAGYMRILPAGVVERFPTMNIHPALLPRYPGLRSIGRALADNVAYTGVTVHLADAGVDTGCIISQGVVSAEPRHSLEPRIHKMEHRLYPEAVRWWAAHGLPAEDRKRRGRPPRHSARPDSMQCGGSGLGAGGAANPKQAASIASRDTPCYIRHVDDSYEVVPSPPPLPYVAAVPGDGPDIIWQRIRRLVGCQSAVPPETGRRPEDMQNNP